MASPENPDISIRSASELKQRLITGVILAAVALVMVVMGGYGFTAFILFFSLMMILEWHALTADWTPRWRAGGYLYVLIPSLCLIMLRRLVFPEVSDTVEMLYAKISPWPVLHLILTVAATDIGAYAAGKNFGRRKLAPSISPGKTWEGLAGGMLAAGVVSALCTPYLAFPRHAIGGFFFGLLLAATAQCGDLFESYVKRRAGVKDSGAFLPGHGGVLDRVDGLLLAAVLYWLIAMLAGGVAL